MIWNVKCPHCNLDCEVDESLVGQKAECPHCAGHFEAMHQPQEPKPSHPIPPRMPPPEPTLSALLSLCPDCRKEISKKAMSCPHCGRGFRVEKAGQWVGHALLWGTLSLAVLFAIGQAMIKSEGETETEVDAGPSREREAYLIAQEFCKRSLKSPATASFLTTDHKPDNGSLRAHHYGEVDYEAEGLVDSQNGFGALIRSEWSAHVVYLKAEHKWHLKWIRVGDKTERFD